MAINMTTISRITLHEIYTDATAAMCAFDEQRADDAVPYIGFIVDRFWPPVRETRKPMDELLDARNDTPERQYDILNTLTEAIRECLGYDPTDI